MLKVTQGFTLLGALFLNPILLFFCPFAHLEYFILNIVKSSNLLQ